ncbi:hypothetical protein [Paenibacillus nasutitermitis]|uniref:Uncharacterized protein n=1 Tax=Paenibacillus nasutitermitis TaxID=1652958 RepID=A0A916ZAU8_9BACL|nr:hypothetical protein [Paenibacillus nasutitermitis]GGD85121.1 hypothetical protein GCM10010911_49410 [Paenibacillus nasutitermitis]
MNIQRTSLRKLLEKQKKQDADYYASEIKASLYSRLSETVEAEIEESSKVITHMEREIEKLQSTVVINKEVIIEALNNFDSLFEEATNEEKRTLLRALVKAIHMEADNYILRLSFANFRENTCFFDKDFF